MDKGTGPETRARASMAYEAEARAGMVSGARAGGGVLSGAGARADIGMNVDLDIGKDLELHMDIDSAMMSVKTGSGTIRLYSKPGGGVSPRTVAAQGTIGSSLRILVYWGFCGAIGVVRERWQQAKI